ncbi:predicted protein [Scheffersomyces stipitis CBS 6054]|uniref:Autophagy-related protein 16 domain-containing protein n=1 Tax=Scheffersomyces stipitis (strain ATCC 58785 / CBS 6054 / NBRC 10063 / NRRL Y-11545) TaxID=322104 RepID=A3LNN6_PICST|nr:predicted protein [Scheffersomyces stipitis CBS 6054]ABN64359.2 predicted protein [Scheffersomyces stipitis CBS 6054]
MSWTDIILQQLNIRDEVQDKESPYFHAFTVLSNQLHNHTSQSEIGASELLHWSVISRENHRLKQENTDLIASLNQSAINLEKAEMALSSEIKTKKSLEKMLARSNTKIDNLGHELKEKDKAIEIINDEILLHQIQTNVLNDKVAELSRQNEVLVQRLMTRAQVEAEKLNDANEKVSKKPPN